MDKIKWFFNEAKHHGFWATVYYIFTKDTCDICEGFAPDNDLIDVGAYGVGLVCQECVSYADAMKIRLNQVEYNKEHSCYYAKYDN